MKTQGGAGRCPSPGMDHTGSCHAKIPTWHVPRSTFLNMGKPMSIRTVCALAQLDSLRGITGMGGPRQPPRWVEQLLSRGPGSDDSSEAPLSHSPDMPNQRAPDCTLEDLEPAPNVVGEPSDNRLAEKHNTATEAASTLTPQPSLISDQTQPLLQDLGTDDSLESETHGNGSDTTLEELPVATESTGGVTKESATCQAEDPNPPNISGPEPAQEARPRLWKRGNRLRRTVRPPVRY